MIKSMTGYGKAEVLLPHKKISVELRALNSKQLDLTVKMPAVFRQSEYEIRNLAAKRLQRGKVDLYVNQESDGTLGATTINAQAFGAYYGQLSQICAENKMPQEVLYGSILESIMRLPEVVQSEAVAPSEEEQAALIQATNEALNRLDEFRLQEGAILMADLLHRIDTIEQLKNEVTPYEEARTETIKTRIRESIANLAIPVDNNRLEQEMIFYIEKLDITEEKVRLQNHCNYFREVAAAEENAGRKLGFITQEIGREINTLGSKSNEANMQKMVVQMKDELEKIKEQLLNIL